MTTQRREDVPAKRGQRHQWDSRGANHHSGVAGTRRRNLAQGSLLAIPQNLPVPPFSGHPEKCGHVEPDPKLLPRNGNPYRSSVTLPTIRRACEAGSIPTSGRVSSRAVSIPPFRCCYGMEVQPRLPLLLGVDNRVHGMRIESCIRSISRGSWTAKCRITS